MFIVIEGIDGAGKGTHTRRLEAELTRVGVDACSLVFPDMSLPLLEKL